MRNANYSLAGRRQAFPIMEDKALSPALTEEGINQEDLQLIDGFSGLDKADRKAVLDMVRHMLHEELQFLPE